MGLFPVKTLLTENTLKFEFGEFQPRVPNCDVVSIVISGSTHFSWHNSLTDHDMQMHN